jgi:hypothetical protein
LEPGHVDEMIACISTLMKDCNAIEAQRFDQLIGQHLERLRSEAGRMNSQVAEEDLP